MRKTSRKSSASLAVAVTAVVAVAGVARKADAEAFKFGVMGDTQWNSNSATDMNNPNSVAVGIINQINQALIAQDVKLVVAVGDVTDVGSSASLATRAAFSQALYNNGIGFYPLRGNHEPSAANAGQFKTNFPQTQTLVNNNTPAAALTANAGYNGFVAKTGSTFSAGSNFSTPGNTANGDYTGLSYSLDYGNARFVLLDQFTLPGGQAATIANQQTWISDRLGNRPAGSHAFVFSHKGIITENHTDVVTGSTPAANPAVQNAFIGSMADNNVKYYVNGHDHMHNRALVTDTNGVKRVQDITSASESYKFYTPASPLSNDATYNLPAFGRLRETPIAQRLYGIGYYIYTVDGPRVTVDYYDVPSPGNPDMASNVVPQLTGNFQHIDRFGYSLNGKEFVVARNQPLNVVDDTSPNGNRGRILAGTASPNLAQVYDGRYTVLDINTGWTDRLTELSDPDLKSDVLDLWGMNNTMGSIGQTDTYVLSLEFDPTGVSPSDPSDPSDPSLYLRTKDQAGNWVNAINLNVGANQAQFISGPYDGNMVLGHYGVDPATNTAWAVINHSSQFVVSVPEPATAGILAAAGAALLAHRRRRPARRASSTQISKSFGTTRDTTRGAAIGSAAAAVALAVAALPSFASAALLVDSFTENFDSMGAAGTTPPASWSMKVGNSGTSNTTWQSSITANGANSVASMVATAGALTATNSPSGTNNNGFNAGAPGNSSNRMLATSPTTVSGAGIELLLTNGTGGPVNSIDVGYDIQRFTAVATANELPGYQLFYSLDGTSWTNVAALNPTLAGPGGVIVPNSVGVTNVPPTTVTLSSAWAAGADLRLRWVDDNAQQTSPDQIIGLDNVSVSVPEPTLALLAPAAVVIGLGARGRRRGR